MDNLTSARRVSALALMLRRLGNKGMRRMVAAEQSRSNSNRVSGAGTKPKVDLVEQLESALDSQRFNMAVATNVAGRNPSSGS